MNRIDPILTRRALLAGTAGALVGPGMLARDGRAMGAAAQDGDDETIEPEIEAWLGRLSRAEKVAQLFMFDAPGTAMTPEYAARLAEERPGGVILLGFNIGTDDEVAAYVAAIHATNPDLPPLVAVDQEGGPVTRLLGDPTPGAVELGLLPDAEVEALSRARAEYLVGFGFDVNFAPVADVAYAAESSMLDRSFGADPELVAAKVAAVVAGAAGSGVQHAAKHFPGHGRTALDSHLALPEVDLSIEEWLATDALPFAAAVEAGVPLVMLGHLRYPQWDDAPASVSAVAVDLLREELGFAGVVVCDDLGMDALAELDPFATVDRAVAAGVDLLLFATPPVASSALMAHLVGRVETGVVSEARIDESLRRLLRLRLGGSTLAAPLVDRTDRPAGGDARS